MSTRFEIGDSCGAGASRARERGGKGLGLEEESEESEGRRRIGEEWFLREGEDEQMPEIEAMMGNEC